MQALAELAGHDDLVFEQWPAAAWLGGVTPVPLVLPLPPPRGVGGAMGTARVQADAGGEARHEDDAAVGAQELRQAGVKDVAVQDRGVAEAHQLARQRAGVGRVRGQVRQGLLPQKLQAQQHVAVGWG